MNDELQGERFAAERKELSEHLTEAVGRNYGAIRDAYQNSYGWPELDPLRHEICLCLLLDLDQAAIALTNHLLESFLKYALAYHHSLLHERPSHGQDEPSVDALAAFTDEGFERYGSKDLGDNINVACSTGLLSKAEKERLHEFRNIFRNAYAHSDKAKTFGESTVPVKALQVEKEGFIAGQEKIQTIADFPMVQGLAQALQARHEALPYFLYLDGLVREVMNSRVGKKANSDDR